MSLELSASSYFSHKFIDLMERYISMHNISLRSLLTFILFSVFWFFVFWHLAVLDAGASSNHASTSGTIKKRVEKPVRDAISIRQKTQKEQEKWLIEREKMLHELEQLDAENSQIETQCQGLEEEISRAKQRISLRESELKGIRQIAEDIQPFLNDTLEWLATETEQGLPFLIDERKKRMVRLREIMDDPAVPVSEKFRKIMEAMLIEAEYGTTVEVTRENITLSEEPVLVNVLRLGRLNLFYQTLDGNRCGVFDTATNRWLDLSMEHNREIRRAMDMALKRRPVELVILPVGRVSAK